MNIINNSFPEKAPKKRRKKASFRTQESFFLRVTTIILCLSYCIYLVKREERKDKDL